MKKIYILLYSILILNTQLFSAIVPGPLIITGISKNPCPITASLSTDDDYHYIEPFFYKYRYLKQYPTGRICHAWKFMSSEGECPSHQYEDTDGLCKDRCTMPEIWHNENQICINTCKAPSIWDGSICIAPIGNGGGNGDSFGEGGLGPTGEGTSIDNGDGTSTSTGPDGTETTTDNDVGGGFNPCNALQSKYQSLCDTTVNTHNWACSVRTTDTEIFADIAINTCVPLDIPLPDNSEDYDCNDLQQYYSNLCPIQNNFYFDCNPTTKRILDNRCEVNATPCYELEQIMTSQCNLQYPAMGGTLLGSCEDNGISVTYNNFNCSENKSQAELNCLSSYHEFWDSTTSSCNCVSGYTRNTFGDCWHSLLDETATEEELTLEQIEQETNNEEIQNTLDENEIQRDNEEQQEQQNDNDSNEQSTINSLSGVRDDLKVLGDKQDEGNELLEQIKNNGSELNDKLENDETLVDDSEFNSALDVFNNMKTTFNGIQSDFNNIKTKIDTGFAVPSFNVGTPPIFEGEVFGKNIKLDLTQNMSIIRPIFYYIFYLSFLMLSIKIYYLGFTFNSRS